MAAARGRLQQRTGAAGADRLRRAPLPGRHSRWRSGATRTPHAYAAALAAVLGTSRLRVEVHGDGSNLGFAEACNRLAALSTSDTVLFVKPGHRDPRLPRSVGADRVPHRCAADLLPAPESSRERSELSGLCAERQRFAFSAGSRRCWSRAKPSSPGLSVVRRLPSTANGSSRSGGSIQPSSCTTRTSTSVVGGESQAASIWVDPRFRVMHIGGVSASSNLLLALQRSYESALTFHSRNAPSRLCFQGVALTEAIVKSFVAAASGRVGRVDRHTQWRFTRWILGSRLAASMTSGRASG